MTRRATKASKIILSKDERDYLERLVRRRKVSHGDAQRAEIVLCAAEGLNNRAVADAVGVTRQTIVAIEQGRYSPSLEVAFRIAAVFGVGLEEVFQWTGEV